MLIEVFRRDLKRIYQSTKRQIKKISFSDLPKNTSTPTSSGGQNNLIHFSNKGVYFIFPVAVVSSLYEVIGHFLVPAEWGVKLKWPQEASGFWEVRTDGEDFMHKVLHANDAVFTCKSSNQIIRFN